MELILYNLIWVDRYLKTNLFGNLKIRCQNSTNRATYTPHVKYMMSWQSQFEVYFTYLDVFDETTRNCLQLVITLLAAGRQRYSSVGYPCIFASTTSSPYSHSMATCYIATKQIHAMPAPKRCLSRSRPRSKRSSEYKFDGTLGHSIVFATVWTGRLDTLVSTVQPSFVFHSCMSLTI